MLITANQISTRYQLKDEEFKISYNNITLERVRKWKLLGVTIEKNVTLKRHVSLLLKKLLFIFERSKNAPKICITVSAQATGRIADLFTTLLL